ncbi:ATP-binding protein [Sphingomonas sp. IC-56]|uniref:ATP-binding protein n=1 Tax=Sphingomonas sp. IC-56 TaxID=2898529 RepID=UPI001E5DE2FD|nr:ATP-binding protein [Sphingomonas sp. IC-56]MCD2325076.1 ATP-binding protein [Sphingomonas sp. IC-56]
MSEDAILPEAPARNARLIQWMVIAAAIGTPLLLVVMTVLVGQGFDRTAALRHELARSYEARAELQHILSLHQDLEIGQRGYLITGDRRFLSPYLEAASQIDSAFAALDRTMPADGRYRNELAQLRRTSRLERAFVDQAIHLSGSGYRGTAQRWVAEGAGKRAMDTIRLLITKISEAERVSLDRATRNVEAARVHLRTTTFMLQGILLALLAGAGLLVMRSNRARDRARRRRDDLAARQAAIFDSASDGMIVLNSSGSIESLNPAAARMFGYAPEDLVRRDIGTLFEVAPDRGRIESFLSRLQARRGLSANPMQEFVGRRRNDTLFPLEVSISTVAREYRPLFVAVCRDISERREIERIKGEFVATVSHELRTPLTSIAGSLGLVAGGAAGTIPPKALRLVQIAQSNSTRLVRLINDILDIEKIEAGRMTFDIKPVELGPALTRVVRDTSGFAAEYNVRIELEAPSVGAAVLADEDRLTQVLTNLLSNAVKFSRPDGVVRVRVSPLDRRFRISVSDQGEGIPEAFRTRIFGKFAQADNSDTRNKGGTGLGLSIVREIVTRLGGAVSFDSTPGEGATFHVDLPATGHTRAAAVAEPCSASLSAKPAILHVDDDPDMLRVLSSVFEDRAELYSTPSVVEAIAAIRHRAFDAAILDIGLADGSGLELVPLLRDRSTTMPIIVFTAQEVEPGQVAGADLVMVKSRASMDQLVAKVLAIINQQRSVEGE